MDNRGLVASNPYGVMPQQGAPMGDVNNQQFAQNIVQWQNMLQEYYKQAQQPQMASAASYGQNPLAAYGAWGSNVSTSLAGQPGLQPGS